MTQHMNIQNDQRNAERLQYQQAMASADMQIAGLSSEKQNTYERLMKSEAYAGELNERHNALGAEKA